MASDKAKQAAQPPSDLDATLRLEQHRIIKSWQRFAVRLSRILHCEAMDVVIEREVHKLSAHPRIAAADEIIEACAKANCPFCRSDLYHPVDSGGCHVYKSSRSGQFQECRSQAIRALIGRIWSNGGEESQAALQGQPALTEIVKEWRSKQDELLRFIERQKEKGARTPHANAGADIFGQCADELEAALAAMPTGRQGAQPSARPEGCICSEAFNVGPEKCGKHGAQPAKGDTK